MAHTYRVICNRVEGDYAVCDDLEFASHIVAALMQTRPANSGDWYEYWVRDDAGNEYSYDAGWNTCFIDHLPAQVAS
jgi:hypothetical protein